MFRVVRRLHAALEHGIVAGVFAFEAQSSGGHPGERVEPRQRAQRFAGQLQQPVVAPDVFSLVFEDDPHTRRMPRLGAARQQDPRPPRPPGHEHGRVVALEESDGFEPHVVRCQFVETLSPRPVE